MQTTASERVVARFLFAFTVGWCGWGIVSPTGLGSGREACAQNGWPHRSVNMFEMAKGPCKYQSAVHNVPIQPVNAMMVPPSMWEPADVLWFGAPCTVDTKRTSILAEESLKSEMFPYMWKVAKEMKADLKIIGGENTPASLCRSRGSLTSFHDRATWNCI